MIAQIKAEITSRISQSYADCDGVQIDVIEMRYPNGLTETRLGWVEENLDGEMTFFIRTAKGDVLKSTWTTCQNNKWLISYTSLWYQRLDKQQNKVIDLKEQEEIELLRAAQLAKADLGFDW